MRLLGRCLALAALTLGAFTAQAACVAPYGDPAQCLGVARSPVTGVRNIGYTVLPSGTDAPNPIGDFVTEIGYYANNVTVAYDPSNPAALAPVLSKLNSGLKLSLVLNSIFLKPDYSDQPEQFIEDQLRMLASQLSGKTAYIAFLAFDEVQWHKHNAACKDERLGFEACLQRGGTQPLVSETAAKLERWSARIRDYFPGVSMAYNESGPFVRPNLVLPKNYDLYSFDCYGNFDSCMGVNASVPSLMATLKQKVQTLNLVWGGHRTLGIIPETQIAYSRMALRPGSGGVTDYVQNALYPVNAAIGAGAANDSSLRTLVQRYTAMAAADPMITTIIGFLWGNLHDPASVSQGLRSFPLTRDYLDAYARNITGKPLRTITTPPSIDFGVTPDMTINNGGAIWAWSAYNATSCRAVTENVPGLPPNGALWVPEPQPPLTDGRSFDYTLECTGPYGTTQKTIRYTEKK